MKILKKILAFIIIFIFVTYLIYLNITGFFQIQLPILTEFITTILSFIDVGVVFKIYKLLREKPKLSIEHSGESVYSEKLSPTTPDGTKICTINYLKVFVKNTGGMARGCIAELRVTNWDKKSISPTGKPKFLTWCNQPSNNISIQKDIARNRDELLHVVLSDSRLENLPDRKDEIFAFVSTVDSIYPITSPYLGEYGFGMGDFEIEIIVTSDNDAIVKSKFLLHVDKDFSISIS